MPSRVTWATLVTDPARTGGPANLSAARSLQLGISQKMVAGEAEH